MQIIPALDLKSSRVVHAAGGDRRLYQPLGNARFPLSDPIDVVRRLLERSEFPLFYIADLDAITGDGDNAACIRRISREFAELDLLVDCGIRTRSDFERIRRVYPKPTVIVATETLRDVSLPSILHKEEKPFALSLDFGSGKSLEGPPGIGTLLEHPENWPETVIALKLSAVGAATGPDLATVRALRSKCRDCRLIAGGGVRGENDLTDLAHAGADAALVANALYTGTLKADSRYAEKSTGNTTRYNSGLNQPRGTKT